MDKFWACDSNKVKFQQTASDFILDQSTKSLNHFTVTSGIITDDKSFPSRSINPRYSSYIVNVEALTLRIEESDMRIIPRIKWALINGAENILVLSNDTDVLALLLYYLFTYKEYGLKQLWIRVGSGNNQRFIPVHVLGEKLGPELCKVILKLHIGTGCDYQSNWY